MMLLYVVFGLFWAAVVVFLVGAPFLAWLAWWRASHLQRRVAFLEERLAHLRPDAQEPIEEVLPAEPPPGPVAAPLPRLPEPPPAEEPPPLRPRDAEGVFGRHVLGWAAVAMLTLTLGYFLQYAFANGWVGPLGQVSLGVLGGALLCLAGWRMHLRGGWLMAQMLTSAGVAALFLSTFASFGYYKLMAPEKGSLYLTALVALTAALAVQYRAQAIAAVALAGGLATPLLIPVQYDEYLSFFGYLLLLDAGMVAVSLLRGWHLLAPAALAGIQGLFYGWFEMNFHPEKLAAGLAFQALLFLLHTAHDVYAPVLARREASAVQLLGVVLASVLGSVLCVAMLERDYWLLLAPLAVALSIHHAADAWWAQARSPADKPLRLTLVALGLGFVAIALALRFDAPWTSAGWAVMALALWRFGLTIPSVPLRAMAGVLFVLAFGLQMGLLGGRFAPVQHRLYFDEWFVPLLNPTALSGLLVGGCLLAAAYETRIRAPEERAAWLVGVLAGVGLGWLVLSGDAWAFCMRNDLPANAVLSVLWTLYAGLVLAVGFWRDSPTVRRVALGLFAIAMLKAVFVDTAMLEGISRVAAFFILSLILGLAAWCYQRLEAAHRTEVSR